MADKKMSEMFELPLYVEFFKVDYEQAEWIIVDETEGQPFVLDNNGKNTKFDGTAAECKAISRAVNSHDTLVSERKIIDKCLADTKEEVKASDKRVVELANELREVRAKLVLEKAEVVSELKAEREKVKVAVEALGYYIKCDSNIRHALEALDKIEGGSDEY